MHQFFTDSSQILVDFLSHIAIILNEYDDLHREYIVFVQNTIDDVVRECEKNEVKVASDGERIWSDNINDLRHFVSSRLLNSTQHTIAF